MTKEAKLAGASLGVWESIVMGIAGTAPAFSVEVTATNSIPTFDTLTNVIGIGGIAIGTVPFALNKRRLSKASVRSS